MYTIFTMCLKLLLSHQPLLNGILYHVIQYLVIFTLLNHGHDSVRPVSLLPFRPFVCPCILSPPQRLVNSSIPNEMRKFYLKSPYFMHLQIFALTLMWSCFMTTDKIIRTYFSTKIQTVFSVIFRF